MQSLSVSRLSIGVLSASEQAPKESKSIIDDSVAIIFFKHTTAFHAVWMLSTTVFPYCYIIFIYIGFMIKIPSVQPTEGIEVFIISVYISVLQAYRLGA